MLLRSSQARQRYETAKTHKFKKHFAQSLDNQAHVLITLPK